MNEYERIVIKEAMLDYINRKANDLRTKEYIEHRFYMIDKEKLEIAERIYNTPKN
jgi:hypothetical protein